MLNLDYSKTAAAYAASKENLTALQQKVHEKVLFDSYIDRNDKKIYKTVHRIMNTNDELLYQAFIGKLSLKLPPLRLGNIGDFHADEAKYNAAALITNILVDNGSLKLEKDVERYMTSSGPKFRTTLKFSLGGSKVKDCFKGIEYKPGVCTQKTVGKWKLKAFEKDVLKTLASQPVCISEVCTKELLLKGYSLKTDWNRTVDKHGNKLKEHRLLRKERYDGYADKIMELKHHDKFYLPHKYDSARRMYPEAGSLEGARLHGKLWETLMIDSAVPYELDEVGVDAIKHLIYSTLYGRCTEQEAVDNFSLEDLLNAENIDPMDQDTEEAFGKAILLNKAAKALLDANDGIPTKFMFGFDLTNSGLIMASSSFRSDKMMKAANLGALPEVVDSHTVFIEGMGMDLPRDVGKKIHMSLMHGETLYTSSKVIGEVLGRDVSEDEVKDHLEDTYGKSVDNILAIGDYGSMAFSNEQTELYWTLPDGFKASCRAFYESVPLEIAAVMASHKEGWFGTVITADMPYLETRSGFPVYTRETVVNGVTYEVRQRKRGLFARATHSLDAYVARTVIQAVVEAGYPIMLKHDDYLIPPAALGIVKDAVREALDVLYSSNMYQHIIDEIRANSPYELPELDIELGEARNTIWESENFLMP